MNTFKTFALSAVTLAMCTSALAQQNTQTKNSSSLSESEFEQILIIGVRSDRVSKGATGLTMEISETPQSISLVSSEQLQNFAAFSLNDALKLATGVNVEEWETNRTNYTSRGFEIKNTQIDGIGMPNNWGIVTGAMDAFGYQEIEVIRGANGLLTGVGNAAGTINYVRKRPTNSNQGEIKQSVGSYGFKRIEADYSMLLTNDGQWAARGIVAAEDKGSYLQGLENDRLFAYAVVDGQLSSNSTLTIGYAYQDANTDGNMWGALVFNYSDGSQAEWDTSATTTQNWTMWDTTDANAFIEYVYVFNNNWEIKTTYNQRNSKEDDKLFYAYGSIDKETGLGLTGWPGRFGGEVDAQILDITTNGELYLFGQHHQLIVGVSHAESQQQLNQFNFDYANTPAFGPTPAFPYALDAIAEPNWLDNTVYSKIDVTLRRAFASSKLNINDDLFIVAGFNAIDYQRQGINNGVVIDNDESEISPYIGATLTLTDNTNLYASYSDIYQPQEQYDFDGYFLDPTKGVNVELGVKSTWFDNQLLTTLALFTAEQEGIASFAGINPDNGQYYYQGIDIDAKGFEIELVGQLTENLNVNLAFTQLSMEDSQQQDAHQWAPRKVINFMLDYRLPIAADIQVGLGGKWQSATVNSDYNVNQGSYAVINGFARWHWSPALAIQANINNLTDEKYITSLHTVGYYAAPLNGSLSLSYKF